MLIHILWQKWLINALNFVVLWQNRPLFFMTLRLRCCSFPPQPHWNRTLQKAPAPESCFKNQTEYKERRETTKYRNTVHNRIQPNRTEPNRVFSLYVISLIPYPPLTTYVVVLGSSFNWRTTKVPATVPMVYFFITNRVFFNSVWSNIFFFFKLLVLLCVVCSESIAVSWFCFSERNSVMRWGFCLPFSKYHIFLYWKF